MKSMYAKYIKERANIDEIITDKGFIHYKFENGVCVIEDYFVLPEYRKSGHGYFLADQVFKICKEADIRHVCCQTDDSANGVELSKHTIENFGFELVLKRDELSFYKMEVSGWEKR